MVLLRAKYVSDGLKFIELLGIDDSSIHKVSFRITYK